MAFRELNHAIRPADHMDALAPLLPRKYAPLQPNGRGLQGVYLTAISDYLGFAIADLIGFEAHAVIRDAEVRELDATTEATGLSQWEEHQVEILNSDPSIDETMRSAIVQARRGQGVFRKRVMEIERACRLTGVERPEHLRASHCKPWRDASNEERLAAENGLLLTPDADHLFDRSFITFDDGGDLLVSPVAHIDSMKRMGIDPNVIRNVGSFSGGQRHFLEFHRENVFLKAKLAGR